MIVCSPLYDIKVIFAYDYILTLSLEIETVWKRKLSGATVVFVLARYGNMISLILQIAGSMKWRNIGGSDADKVRAAVACNERVLFTANMRPCTQA